MMTTSEIDVLQLGPTGGVDLPIAQPGIMRQDQNAVGRDPDVDLDHVRHLGGRINPGQHVVGVSGRPPSVADYLERLSRNPHYKSIAPL
jgi:hypothetical protein